VSDRGLIGVGGVGPEVRASKGGGADGYLVVRGGGGGV